MVSIIISIYCYHKRTLSIVSHKVLFMGEVAVLETLPSYHYPMTRKACMKLPLVLDKVAPYRQQTLLLNNLRLEVLMCIIVMRLFMGQGIIPSHVNDMNAACTIFKYDCLMAD